MNALTKDLIRLVKETENAAPADGRFRQKLHLMPPAGWLNDPNGLCQFQGVYHAFFQYSPFNAEGGVKMWGHYTSRDMLHWEYQGVALYPDQPFDCHGVYSGSAFIEQGKMYLYYTGNVKREDQEYDYIVNGRESNTVLVESTDGFHFGPKQLLMKNSDYPADLTCHVRDPKVWKQEGRYYMIQGARTREDQGVAQIFSSEDRRCWKPAGRITTRQPFGYMWECPDYMNVEGQQILSASVQGLEGGIWEERNVYQSGYFLVDGEIPGDCSLSDYRLWDYGFDYYAPQSFTAEDGRTIIMAWMGMPDCEEYGNAPALEEGWQHCFTFPREIFIRNGQVCQRPVRELEQYRKEAARAEGTLKMECPPAFEADITGIEGNAFRAVLAEGLVLEYKNGCFEMRFEGRKGAGISGGRSRRSAAVPAPDSIKILGDASSVEVFIDGGSCVFTTRYYPDQYTLDIQTENAQIAVYELQQI